MAMVLVVGQIKNTIKVNGKQIKCMVVVILLGMMVENIKGNIKMI